MKQYTFVVEAVISLHVDVEANTSKEAVAKAQHASVMSLCHQCARSREDEWTTSGELDTDPASSKLVDVIVNDEPLEGAALKRIEKLWR